MRHPDDMPAPNRLRLRLWIELVVLFVGIPVGLAAWAYVSPGRVPVIPVLVVLGAGVAIALTRDRTFSWREEFAVRAPSPERRRVILLAVVGAAVLTALAASGVVHRLVDGPAASPGAFLSFPREKPRLWAMVIFMYPLLSVIPQEIMYRTFFFHRYRSILGSLTVGVSALAFAVAHLMFWNGAAVVMTLAGGLLFAVTYARTRSLGLAVLEHSVYGNLVFTLGFGPYFYGGTSAAIGG